MTQYELKNVKYTDIDGNFFQMENIAALQQLITRLSELHKDRVFDTNQINETLEAILIRLPSNVVRVEYDSSVKESNLLKRRDLNQDNYSEGLVLVYRAEDPIDSSLTQFIYDMQYAEPLPNL